MMLADALVLALTATALGVALAWVALKLLLAVLVFKKLVRPAAAVVCTAVMVAGTLACNAYNNHLLVEPWLYQRVALCYQTAALVQDADPVEDAEALALMSDPLPMVTVLFVIEMKLLLKAIRKGPEPHPALPSSPPPVGNPRTAAI